MRFARTGWRCYRRASIPKVVRPIATKHYFKNYATYDLVVRGDARGSLVAVEAQRDIPFDIQRVYFIYGMQARVERGFHVHRELHQFAICVTGSCTMVLDDGCARREVEMARPDLGIHVDPMIWHEIKDFAQDCVLTVLADAPYFESDYIRDHDAFLAAAAERAL